MNTNNQFLKEFFELDLHYCIIVAHMNLVTFAFKINETHDLAEKLHLNFVKPIFSIVKDKMMGITGNLYFDSFYDTFSKKELLKIKKFICNNIDSFEILFAPFVHEYQHEYKNEHDYEYIPYYITVNFHQLKSLKYIYLLQKHVKNNKHHLYNKLGLIEDRLTEIILNFCDKKVCYERSFLTNS